MNIPAPADTFHLLRGTPKTYLKISDRGNRRIHAFCRTCRGPVYSSAAENVELFAANGRARAEIRTSETCQADLDKEDVPMASTYRRHTGIQRTVMNDEK
ncbi:GFA family protein [Paraburkholderia sp. MM5477-R1]|uniref:GFA family protein n=1 Tax=Paraburkholderia sp. MM5477-R1 TaxID=2991062 RepID=UPI003D1CCB27